MTAAAAPAEQSLASIAGSDPLPIRPVTTRGRIVFLFRLQERYPQLKQPGWIESYFQGFGHKKSFTLRGCDVELGKVWKGQACNGVRRRESSRGQMKLTLVCGTFPVRFILTDAVSSDQEQPVHVVCKLNSAPKIKLELDSIIKLCNVEVRRAWVKSDQTQPEGHLWQIWCPSSWQLTLPQQRGAGDRLSGLASVNGNGLLSTMVWHFVMFLFPLRWAGQIMD